jgi:hypothetical protein
MNMLYDRVIQIASSTGAYDLVKTTDMLLDLHDVNPSDLKPDKSVEEKFEEGRVGKSIQLATVENQMMVEGQELPPTPFAPSQHTEVHIASINSPEIMELESNSPILANLTKHIMGEIQQQEQRKSQMAQEQGPGMQYKPPSGPSAISQGGSSQVTGDQALPQRGQTQQIANNLGGVFNAG